MEQSKNGPVRILAHPEKNIYNYLLYILTINIIQYIILKNQIYMNLSQAWKNPTLRLIPMYSIR